MELLLSLDFCNRSLPRATFMPRLVQSHFTHLIFTIVHKYKFYINKQNVHQLPCVAKPTDIAPHMCSGHPHRREWKDQACKKDKCAEKAMNSDRVKLYCVVCCNYYTSLLVEEFAESCGTHYFQGRWQIENWFQTRNFTVHKVGYPEESVMPRVSGFLENWPILQT